VTRDDPTADTVVESRRVQRGEPALATGELDPALPERYRRPRSE